MLTPPTPRRHRRRRAVILILSMWMVVVLSLLAYSLDFEVRVETKLTVTYRDQFRAEQLAQLGVARAVADIRNDHLIQPEPGVRAFDALGDTWAGTLLPRQSCRVSTRSSSTTERTPPAPTNSRSSTKKANSTSTVSARTGGR